MDSSRLMMWVDPSIYWSYNEDDPYEESEYYLDSSSNIYIKIGNAFHLNNNVVLFNKETLFVAEFSMENPTHIHIVSDKNIISKKMNYVVELI